jgi:phosphoribosylglycinamide formyltransferase 1
MRKARVGVLISGRGSNMRALVEAGRDPAYPAEVVLVASNIASAGGIAWASEHGIATAVVDHKQFPSREAFDAAMNAELQKHNLDLICCAGFMRIMTTVLIAPWSGRMLNIHPSLLPDYKGLNTHARAIADGRKEAGCTVHIVTEELDGGPIIAQTRVPILPGDTEETLSSRILAEEHPLYVRALAEVAQSLAARRETIQRGAD